MLLDLSKLCGDRDRVERDYVASDFGTENAEFCVAEPVHLALDVRKERDHYRLQGRLRTRLEIPCGRCLEGFPYPVNVALDLRYLPQDRNTGCGEREVEMGALSTAFYRDEIIDLGQLMNEQFYLALPMKPLCGEECKGLCPECGTNLNQSSCACRRVWRDPRWAALEGLLKDDQKRTSG